MLHAGPAFGVCELCGRTGRHDNRGAWAADTPRTQYNTIKFRVTDCNYVLRLSESLCLLLR